MKFLKNLTNVITGDYVKVHCCKRDKWLLVISVMDPISNAQLVISDINDQSKLQYRNAEFQVKYWKEHENINIESPTQILICKYIDVNDEDVLTWCFPNTVILAIKRGWFNRRLHAQLLDECGAVPLHKFLYWMKKQYRIHTETIWIHKNKKVSTIEDYDSIIKDLPSKNWS